ncbi:S-layer homology domain-containing protein [Paenibacillus alginolyticus]|uniref:S-layer homology domain-containing protein n=1 Tax=Paenibacillus alginolyticus TaxID=59839 RepID=UPI0004278EDB|nr:S-layer homology domain-containing protein [Paenibacillus alginolyticus]MCY9665674.1 S-layer homology domain-containing protein [Paenibacillus alginolyticus]
MLKKLLVFSLTLLLTMFLLPQIVIHANSGPTFLLSITNQSVSEGNDFQVTVSGKQLSDMYAYEVNLTFDPSHLKFVKSVSKSEGYTVNPIVNGNKIQIAHTQIGNKPGENGDVTLATLTFHAVNQGSANIELDSVKLMNSQLVPNIVSIKSKLSVLVKRSGNSGKPAVDIFNSDIVNVINLVRSIESKVMEAKKSTAKIELADIEGHWAEKTIDTFVKLHVIDGYENGTFQPDGKITRAEFAVMIFRVFDISGDMNHSLVLNDIDRHWAKNEIEKLASAGVIAGYGDGTFQPDKTISREEMVVMLSRIVNLSKADKDTSKGNFADMASASSYAMNQIKDAAEAGIISGKNDGIFDPQGNSTRAEALTIILNALNLDPQVKTLLDSLN